MAPTIGITTYHTNADWRGWSEEGALLPFSYVTSIRNNGGRPVLLPPGGDEAIGETPDLGRLPTPLPALERDEKPARHERHIGRFARLP